VNEANETTRRLVPPDAKLMRADARLKLVKACDDVADALEKLHRAIQKADKRDLLVVASECPIPVCSTKEESMLADDVQAFAREAMLWAAHLHDNNRFEQLGTRRWPDTP